MAAVHILALSGIVALIAALILARRKAAKDARINEARKRAQTRSATRNDQPTWEDGIHVADYDPYSTDPTPSQMALLELMSAGYRPEIKRDGYKYSGMPLNRIAGIPESYNDDWNK